MVEKGISKYELALELHAPFGFDGILRLGSIPMHYVFRH